MSTAKSSTKFRLERPAPARRYFDGNLLVQQTRSQIGCTSEQRDTLRSLGLGKLGGTSISDVTQQSARAQLVSVDHLVAVWPLTSDAIGFAGATVDSLLVETDGPETSLGDRSFVGPFGAFFSVASTQSGKVTTWAGALPAATFLKRVSRTLSLQPVGQALIGGASAETSIEVDSSSGFERLTKDPSDVAFVRLQFGDVAVAWEGAMYPKHVDEYIVPGTVSIRAAADISADVLTSLIVETAIPEIALHARDLAEVAQKDE